MATSNLDRLARNPRRLSPPGAGILLATALMTSCVGDTSGGDRGDAAPADAARTADAAHPVDAGDDPADAGDDPIDTAASPFGIFGPFEFLLDGAPDGFSESTVIGHLDQLGARWVQEMPPGLDAFPAGLHLYTRIGHEGGFNGPDGDLAAYASALRAFVAQHREDTKYYEVDTEPSGFPPPMGWLGYEAEYVALLEASHAAIVAECSDCKVVLGGFSGLGITPSADDQHTLFLKQILALGAAAYFDVFSFKQHHYPAGDYVEIAAKMNLYRGILADYGVDIDAIPVFLETATYDGQPYYPPGHPLSFLDFPAQSEAEQAAALVKIHLYAIGAGVDKVFWNEVVERHDFGGLATDPFNFYGLVNNPKNDGRSTEKLAYYTYQKLVELLDGADWAATRIVKDQGGVVLVELDKDGRHLWVAWNDNASATQLVVSGVAGPVAMTYLVPTMSGDNPTFQEEQLQPAQGQVTLTLAESPVLLVEE